MKKEILSSEEMMAQNNEGASVLKRKPLVVRPAPLRMPIGFYDGATKKFYKGYEVRGLDAGVLVSIEDQGNPFKTFGKIVAKGIVRIFDPDTGEEAPNWKNLSSKLFFPDVFFLMTEIIVETKGSSLIHTAYQCPKCKQYTKFENNPGEGFKTEAGFALDVSDDEFTSLDMEDIRDMEFNEFNKERPVVEVEFRRGVVIDGISVTKLVFSIPEIGDYIKRGGSGRKARSVERDVLFECIIGVNDLSEAEVRNLKVKYGNQLLVLPLDEYMLIVKEMNNIGYAYHRHKVRCFACGYEYETAFDLTNFFGSLLIQ